MQVKYTREQMMLLLAMGRALATRHCTVPQSTRVLPGTSSSAGRTPSQVSLSLKVHLLCYVLLVGNCQSMHKILMKPVIKAARMPDCIAVRIVQMGLMRDDLMPATVQTSVC